MVNTHHEVVFLAHFIMCIDELYTEEKFVGEMVNVLFSNVFLIIIVGLK